LSQSGSQAAAFFRDVVRTRELWTLRDIGGHPVPEVGNGVRAMPFWSTESRVCKVIAKVEAYRGFEPVRIGLDAWRERWIPGLARDGLLIGVNWSGPRATGWDLEPEAVSARLDAAEVLAEPSPHV
jgi:hypothetical protein